MYAPIYDPRFPPPPVDPSGKMPEAPPPGVWRDGPLLVMQKGAYLPARCIHCNEPAAGRPYCKTYYWHHPGFYFLALAGLLIYAIVALGIREKGTVCLGLCEKHRTRRRNNILIGWLTALGGIGMCVLTMNLDLKGDSATYFGIASVAVFVFGLIWGTGCAGLMRPKRIDAWSMMFKGCGEPFLASLPQMGPFAGFAPPVHYGSPVQYGPPPGYGPPSYGPPPGYGTPYYGPPSGFGPPQK